MAVSTRQSHCQPALLRGSRSLSLSTGASHGKATSRTESRMYRGGRMREIRLWTARPANAQDRIRRSAVMMGFALEPRHGQLRHRLPAEERLDAGTHPVLAGSLRWNRSQCRTPCTGAWTAGTRRHPNSNASGAAATSTAREQFRHGRPLTASGVPARQLRAHGD